MTTGSLSYDKKRWTAPSGKTYHLFATYQHKRTANAAARALKGSGFSAKVLENQTGRYAEDWDVFVYPEAPGGVWDKYRGKFRSSSGRYVNYD